MNNYIVFLRIILSPPLWLLSQLYSVIIRVKTCLYEKGILKRMKLEGAKVICVGNITVGGTGKTSTVLSLAESLRDRGLKPAILTRGYKKFPGAEPASIVTDGNNTLLDVSRSGDEPYLMAQKLSGIPIIAGTDRFTAGKFMADRFKPEIVIMDDGFQHLKLQRDLDIVLIDCLNPFGYNFLLPFGLLREPLNALRRAGIIVLTNTNLVKEKTLDWIIAAARKVNCDLLFVKSFHKPLQLIDFITKDSKGVEYLKGKEVSTLCAIGNPLSFEKTVETLGAKIDRKYRFLDHHWYSEKEIMKILKSNKLVLTTEKDAVRMEKFIFNAVENQESEHLSRLLVLTIKLQAEDTFVDAVLERIKK